MLICPKCGKNNKEKSFVGPFCSDCYEFKIRIPKHTKVRECKKCGRIKMNKGWTVYNKKKIEEYVKEKFKGGFEKIDYYLDSFTAVMYFRVEGKLYMVDKKFEPKLEVTVCPECSKKSGGYFEAIIQVRGDQTKIDKFAMKLEKFLRNTTFITKTKELKEGIDLYVGSSKAVVNMFRELRMKAKISRKLFTQKKGKRMYRTTFAIRV